MYGAARLLAVSPVTQEGTGRLDNEKNTAREEGPRGSSRKGKGDSHVFLVRLWLAENPESDVQWKGRVQHILKGESCSFTGPDMLISCLAALLQPGDNQPPRDGQRDDRHSGPVRPEEAGS